MRERGSRKSRRASPMKLRRFAGVSEAGAAAEIPSNARDLISQTRFDPRSWIEKVTQGISDEIE